MQRAGFVLVGGRSTRMGRDKARLPSGSQLLVEQVAERVREVAGNVALVGAAQRYRDLPFDSLDDFRPDLGPLSGIEAALASGRGELNLIVACDMPNLPSLPLERLVEEAETHAPRPVILRDPTGRLHPLCGVWSSDCLPDVRRALDAQRLRVSDLVEQVGALVLDVPVAISNLNTPDEWHAWRSSLARDRL